MKDKSNLSNASDYFNFNSNNVSGISKNNNLNLTKISNESSDFKELNKEIFQMIQQGGNLSGVNNTNLSISSNNNSNSLPSFNDINWKKKCSHENSSFFDKKDGNNSSLSNVSIIPKKQIEVLNMRNTFDEKDMSFNNNNNNNINSNINNNKNINNNNINGNNFNNNNKNNNNIINNNNINSNYNNKNNNYNGNNYNKYNKFSLIPEDTQEEQVENKILFNNVKKITNKNENKFNNNNINMNNNINNNINHNMGGNNMNNLNNNNNLMINYASSNMMNLNNNINISSKNFVKKNNFQMIPNNSNNSNILINNIRNPQNSNPNFLYYQNQLNQNMNNYYYNNQPQQYMFPENAFSYNNNINQSQNNNMNYQNNQSNWKDNNEKKTKTKKKFKEKIEQKLFVIDLDNIIKGTDSRTTVMIRHIPNKYTSQTLLEELNTICKNKYDFFYLPIDNDNDFNLGYAFINFINPLHIVHFYHIFKARKWKLYKSNKECDLTFAKFQGKSELTANLDKNMNKIEDKKKLPMVFEVMNPPKIDLEKKYYDEIKMNRSELLKNINWI